MAVKPVVANDTAEALLVTYIERLDGQDHKLIRSVRAALRKRLPTANELLYDYKTFFVITYSPTEHPLDAIVSMAARPDGVRMYFMNALQLPNAKKLLKGSGKQARYIEIESVKQLAQPAVEALIASAIEHAAAALPSTGGGKMVLRAGAAKQASPAKARKA